ncbi:isochorismatase family protein [Desulfogranum marinum]|jgi:nicotinamidase/pyrazinamidase|uniref:isochorismatase family protein n=1 Tax=Desulfogranum marinum TaxID=453220 RepID=UPI001962BCE5|nr:isochorismatase family protein [Desulfogranum marinum]MBM9514135.1 isochorismatase family protein [Desulfogranum marinum]
MISPLDQSDALLLVDVQNDFLEGGSLAVPDADAILPVLNRYLALFADRSLQIVASRDWHPAEHCSFVENGGQWPPHCVADTPGAAFSQSLILPASCYVVSKATTAEHEAYSGFDGTELTSYLQQHRVKRLFIGGLATDYCVLQTVLDALKNGFAVVLLVDAIRAVDVQSGDGARAIAKMIENGAQTAKLTDIKP